MSKEISDVALKESIIIHNNGYNYCIPQIDNDPILTALMQNEIFEKEVLDACLQFIRPDSTVIDVGANYGQMTLHFSTAVGATGEVIAIEASNFVGYYLQKTLRYNPDVQNVRIFNNACWSESWHSIRMGIPNEHEYYTGGFYSGASIKINDQLQDCNYHMVKTVAIDDIPKKSAVSFIKVDIQGSDLYALRGARKTLLADRPYVIFEYEQSYDNIFNVSFQDYIDFFTEVNYAITFQHEHNFFCEPR